MGSYHPQVVHFAVALVFVGVGFRLLSLLRRFAWPNFAAAMLILLGTVACFAAVQTGTAAHGPVERIPGARPAVMEHEAWGERARNIFAVVSAVEIVVLGLTWAQHAAAFHASILSAVIGLAGAGAMYAAASRGGELTYSYAGGVGTRSGTPEDVNRVFLAGVYQQALQDRQSGRVDDAMALIELAAGRLPSNLDLQLMSAEWLTDVKRDPAAAIQRIDSLQIPSTDTRARVRAGLGARRGARGTGEQGRRSGGRANAAGRIPAERTGQAPPG